MFAESAGEISQGDRGADHQIEVSGVDLDGVADDVSVRDSVKCCGGCRSMTLERRPHGRFESRQSWLLGRDVGQHDAGVEKLQSIALNLETSQWRRFAATKAIADIRNEMRTKGNTAKADALQSKLEAIKAKETDATLKMYYDMF